MARPAVGVFPTYKPGRTVIRPYQSPLATGPADPRGGPLSLLASREYRALWLIGAFIVNARATEVLAISIYVFGVTGSPLLVAMMLFARMLPYLLFGAAIGTLASSIDRRTLMAIGLGVMTTWSAGLAYLAATGAITLWQVAAGAILNGIIGVTDFPVRRTLLAEAAGPERVGAAMALDSVTFNCSLLLGPAIGGLLMETVGLQGVYLSTVVLLAGSLALTLRLRPDPRSGGAPAAPFLANLIAGMRYARSRGAIIGALAVTVLMNCFAFPFHALVPVIGKELLGLGPFLVGLLAAAYGMGSIAGSLWFSARPPANVGRVFFYGAMVTTLPLAVFAFSPWFALSVAALLVSGLGAAAYVATQSAVVLAHASPEMWARVMGLMVSSIGAAPLGVLFMGLMATGFGASWAIAVSALVGLAGLTAVRSLWRDLNRAR